MFRVYKPGQGMFVRWGTVAFAAILVLIGLMWLSSEVLIQTKSVASTMPAATAVATGGAKTDWQWISIKISVLLVFGLGSAFAVFSAVNRPKSAEFMIMTESEMRKVHWPTRNEVFNSTKVVIFITLVLGIILFLVDRVFNQLFNWMHLYGKGTGQ